MKTNVLFNRSNSLQTSEAKHTNDRAAKFSFLDHKKLSHSEEVIPSGGGLSVRLQCIFFYCCIKIKWEPGEASSLRGVAVADH